MKPQTERGLIAAGLTIFWVVFTFLVVTTFWPSQAEGGEFTAAYLQVQREDSRSCQTLSMFLLAGPGELKGYWADESCEESYFEGLEYTFYGSRMLSFLGSTSLGPRIDFNCRPLGFNVHGERGTQWRRYDSEGDTETARNKYERVWRSMECDLTFDGESFRAVGQYYSAKVWAIGEQIPVSP